MCFMTSTGEVVNFITSRHFTLSNIINYCLGIPLTYPVFIIKLIYIYTISTWQHVTQTSPFIKKTKSRI